MPFLMFEAGHMVFVIMRLSALSVRPICLVTIFS